MKPEDLEKLLEEYAENLVGVRSFHGDDEYTALCYKRMREIGEELLHLINNKKSPGGDK